VSLKTRIAFKARRRLLIQERAILHENTKGFSVDLLLAMLGHMYVVAYTVLVDCADLGVPNDRIRRLTWLYHKSSVITPICSFPSFFDLCKRECEALWDVFLVATEEELRSEFQWASKRRTSCFKLGDSETDFTGALTSLEMKHLDGYQRLCPRGVAMLQQNPWCHPQCNMDRPRLHTLFRRMTLVYSLVHKRWFTPMELLTVMMFPTTVGPWGETCSFTHDRSAFDFPPRSRGVVIEQAGNSMNVCVIGVALMWWLLVSPMGKSDLGSKTESSSSAVGEGLKQRMRNLEKRLSEP
jgi:hypothetical protein